VENKTDKQLFFEAALTRLMDRLYGAVLRFTRNRSDAEDLMAEALEKAWNGFDTLDDLDKFDGWVMRILSNSYISQWRSNKKRAEIFDDEPCPHDLDDRDSIYARLHQPFLPWWGTPEQAFIDKLLGDDIAAAIDAPTDADICAHLHKCRECFSRIEFEKALKKKVASAAEVTTPDDTRARMEALIRRF